jgi:glycogen debranching enzyme
MSSAHARPGDPPRADVTSVTTLVNGSTFLLCNACGDLDGGATGWVVRERRHLSHLVLTVDGERLRDLVVETDGAQGLWTTPETAPTGVERRRHVGPDRLRETITIHATAPVTAEVTFDADFINTFRLRGGGTSGGDAAAISSSVGNRLLGPDGRVTRIAVRPTADLRVSCTHRWRVPAGTTLTIRIDVQASGSDPDDWVRWDAPTFTSSIAFASTPAQLADTCRTSLDDLRRLAMGDPRDPSRRLIAAGIPWYAALFGRDSLITTMQVRVVDATLMLDTLTALAERQGRRCDPTNDEAPGKILHEERFTDRAWFGDPSAGPRPHFGSVDVTPLFVIALAEAWRWGAGRATITPLMPAARAAMAWIDRRRSRNRRGFVDHEIGEMLRNQGWKDSPDSIQFADGRIADGPIALVEVQGYAARAYDAFADLTEAFGSPGESSTARLEGAQLREAVRDAFWIGGSNGAPGYFAVALDGAGGRVDAVASNMGHLLWCDVPRDDQAAQLAEHLGSAELASGWGLRTLSRAMRGYDPASYHRGSVWPHDTAIVCDGLRRYGHDALALRLASDVLDAAATLSGSLPELLGGEARLPGAGPVLYPAACHPQAWATGTPLALLTTFLGIAVDVPNRVIRLRPRLPGSITALRVDGIRIGDGYLGVEIGPDGTIVHDTPPGIDVRLD